jgi:TPR repeat protein
MKNILHVALVCFAFLHASAIEPAKRRLIDEVMEVTNVQATLGVLRNQNVEAARQMLEQTEVAVDGIMARRIKDRMLLKYADYARELFSWHIWEPRYVDFYDKAFTEPQLKALVAFLKTDTGQAMLRSQVVLANQLQQYIVDASEESQRRMDKIFKETLNEVSAEMGAEHEQLQNASLTDLEAKARGGDALAQLRLGEKYAFGEGVEKNLVEAVKWLRMAADQGSALAQSLLGSFYLRGEGTEKHAGLARKYFTSAAEAGEPYAAYMLGLIYLQGEGVEKDPKQAFPWLLKAANAGHGPAQYEVTRLYWNGEGVERNLVEAYAWGLVAVEAEVEGAQKLKEFMNPRLDRDQSADGMMRSVELKRAIKAKLQATAK